MNFPPNKNAPSYLEYLSIVDLSSHSAPLDYTILNGRDCRIKQKLESLRKKKTLDKFIWRWKKASLLSVRYTNWQWVNKSSGFNHSTEKMTLYLYWLGLLGLRELCYPLVLGHPLKGKYVGTVPLHITSRDGRISHLKPRKISTWVSCLCWNNKWR